MTFATSINAVLVVVCLAVLIQSWRMERRMKAFRETQLSESVVQLDRATAQARTVLGELKKLLATDGLAHASALSTAEALRDELSVMVGIGNAVAERIMEAAAGTHGEKEAVPAVKPRRRATKAKTTQSAAETTKDADAKPTRRRTSTRKTTATKAVKSASPRKTKTTASSAEADAGNTAVAAEANFAATASQAMVDAADAGEVIAKTGDCVAKEAPRKSGEVVVLSPQDQRREVTLREVAAA